MKKKLQKRLMFNKSTVANLGIREQSLIRGGGETDPQSGCPTAVTDCDTCYTDCGQATCGCPPSIDCETIRPRLCPTELCQ